VDNRLMVLFGFILESLEWVLFTTWTAN